MTAAKRSSSPHISAVSMVFLWYFHIFHGFSWNFMDFDGIFMELSWPKIHGSVIFAEPGAARPHGWGPGNGAATDGKSGATSGGFLNWGYPLAGWFMSHMSL